MSYLHSVTIVQATRERHLPLFAETGQDTRFTQGSNIKLKVSDGGKKHVNDWQTMHITLTYLSLVPHIAAPVLLKHMCMSTISSDNIDPVLHDNQGLPATSALTMSSKQQKFSMVKGQFYSYIEVNVVLTRLTCKESALATFARLR